MFDAAPSRADLIRTAFPEVTASLRLAEDAGFVPASGLHPTAFQIYERLSRTVRVAGEVAESDLDANGRAVANVGN